MIKLKNKNNNKMYLGQESVARRLLAWPVALLMLQHNGCKQQLHSFACWPKSGLE